MIKFTKKEFAVYNKLQSEVYSLLDKDPKLALDKIRNIEDIKGLPPKALDSIKASIYVDAGYKVNDFKVVQNGVDIFWKQFNESEGDFDLAYNLANGLFNLSCLFPTEDKYEWFNKTHDLRKKSRFLYDYCSKYSEEKEIITQALTNFGNLLIGSQRSLEAFDAYTKALLFDPENGIASTGAAKILLHYSKYGLGDHNSLMYAASKYLKMAKMSKEKIVKYAGKDSLEKLNKLLEMGIEEPNTKKNVELDSFQEFIMRHRLTLSPTFEGLDISVPRFDSLLIESIIESRDAEFGVPPIFAMFNILKSDYLAARLLAFKALETNAEDSGYYMDTLDYANYGINISLLTLSQRSCIDILDKIAVATCEYFDFKFKANDISFLKNWYYIRKKDESIQWKDEIKKEIEKGNYSLIALSELSEDLKEDGYLQIKKKLRHASTHRFAVLHEMGSKNHRKCQFIEHYDLNEFKNELISTLQVVRSSLFYFMEMVRINEYFKNQEVGLKVPLDVPSHHYIRGE